MKINQLTKGVGIGVFFLFANMNAQSNKAIITSFLKSDATFRNNSNVEFKIQNEEQSKSLNSDIVNVQQFYNNTPIYKSLAKAVVRDGKVISFNNNFIKPSEEKVASDQIDKSEALSAALRSIDIKQSNFELVDESKGSMINLPDNKVANFRFYYTEKNNLVPAQLFFINSAKESKHYSILVSLLNGEILEKNNMVVECNFGDGHLHSDNEENNTHFASYVNPNTTKPNLSKSATNASYNVFPFPIEAPTFGSRSVITNPWDLTASPEGWHSNGTVNFTNTYGNNVLAYIDNNATNAEGFSPTSSTTGNLTFDFPFAESPTLSAYDNKSSAVTNLFYANNMMHDIMYKFGFTEATKNFQTNNFGKGGSGNDAVRAEAYDGSGYNNANFNSGYEILSGSGNYSVQAPRMQMFLWNYSVPLKQRLFYTDQAFSGRQPVNTGVVAYYPTGGVPANYYVGKNLMETGVTGDVIVPSVESACTEITAGSLTGKIAIVTTASCAYDVKARNAQNAGAIGVIIHRTASNIVSDTGINNSTSNDIHIPTIILPKDEGDFIKSQLSNSVTVNVNLKDLAVGYKNSSFDNGVMAHEYGHGISNRLTGQGYSCLTNPEQMGEGWSDFFAFMLTNSPGASGTNGRGIATYSTNTTTNALGIRAYKYSTDMSVNPFTYAYTNSTNGVHYIGSIWATMLWDLHWKMAEKYGYSSDVTANLNSGSAKTLRLVMDGLKLQPCNPNFVSGRDAILQADQLAGGNDNCLIWNVFARRGLGVNASAGTSSSILDQVADFTIPPACVLATDEVNKNKKFGIYPNPSKGEFFIKTTPTVGNTTVKVEILDMDGKLVKSLERKKNSSESISTKGLVKGTYLVVMTENGKSDAQKLIVE